MDKDRIVQSAKEMTSKAKQAVEKAVDEAKRESEGAAGRVKSKVHEVMGGLKDAIKGK